MRQAYQYKTAVFAGGINQDAETADFYSQCDDARNVWCPQGEVTIRPGSEFMLHSGVLMGSAPDLYTVSAIISKDVSGTFTTDTAGTLSISSMAVDDKLYIGWTSLPSAALRPLVSGIEPRLNTTNGNATRFKMQYWNGTDWAVLPSLVSDYVKLDSKIFQAGDYPNIMFGIPNDWTASAVTGTGDPDSYYYLRLVLKDAAVDASTAFAFMPIWTLPNGPSDGIVDATRSTFRSVWTGQIGATRIYGAYWFNYTNIGVGKTGFLVGRKGVDDVVMGYTHTEALPAPNDLHVKEPVTSCSVSYDNAVYVTLPGGVYQVTPTNYITPTNYNGLSYWPTLTAAAVEDSPAIVGSGVPGAPYDKSAVAQLGTFPICKYIAFFQNRFWCAGIEGAPQLVRWGAAAPSHRVFPSVSYEDVIENNGEAISGMAPLGANMIIYKPNSIHQMIYTGLAQVDANFFATFVPQTKSIGVGCVSNASIADVNGRHVFLSNNGIMLFDGVTTHSLSHMAVSGAAREADRLQDIWPDLDPGRFPFAVGVHWKAKKCYLLACSYKGSGTNNLVIVWDYVRNAFWLWDGLDVAGWFFEDAELRDLCYSDSYGRFFKLSGGSDFGTAISAYVTTTQSGLNDIASSNMRLMEMTGDSDNTAVTATFYTNESTGDTGTVTFADPIEAVYGTGVWGTAAWGARKARYRRLSTWSIGRNHQVKISTATKNARFTMDSLKLGFLPAGKR